MADEKRCTDDVVRTYSWIGQVGLIYPSDYGYASTDLNCKRNLYEQNSTCNQNNWLHPSNEYYYYWTIVNAGTKLVGTTVWTVSNSNHVDNNNSFNMMGVHPSVYLTSSIKIIGGDGNTTPYKLSV